jgi:hypothetical protein
VKNLEIFLRTLGYQGSLPRFWMRPAGTLLSAILALALSAGVVMAVRAALQSSTTSAQTATETFTLNGNIQQIAPAQWIVEGVPVIIDTQTRIDGTPTVGTQAAIQGIMLEDGTLYARTITIQTPPIGAIPPAPTVVLPTTAATIPVPAILPTQLPPTSAPLPASPTPLASPTPPIRADNPFTALRALLTLGVSDGRVQGKAGVFLLEKLDQAQQAASEGRANQLQKPLRDMQKKIRDQVRDGTMDSGLGQQLLDGIAIIAETYAAQPSDEGDDQKGGDREDGKDDDSEKGDDD